MAKLLKWIKVININILVILGLIIFIEISLLISFYIRDNLAQGSSITHYTIGKNHTNEVIGFNRELNAIIESNGKFGFQYRPFIGWSSPNIDGEYINIKNGQRVTELSSVIEHNETIYFFGGSTMWGHSVSDKNTIPSLVSKKLRINTVNYGEQAYNSRQSLNSLINNIDSINSGDVIVFYNGVNDVFNNCRSHNSPNGHAREYFIRDKLSTNDINFLTKSSTIRFLKGLSSRIYDKDNNFRKGYVNSCSSLEYSEQVADFLINNWKAAEAITLAREINFICALMPNPYTFDGDISYSQKELRAQIKAVYPLIKDKAKNLSCFKDYSAMLKVDNYVDSCCHLNEYGNREISNIMIPNILNLLN